MSATHLPAVTQVALAALGALALATACGGTVASGPAPVERARSHVIGFGEITASESLTAYEAILRLRPRLLRGQPSGAQREPPVVSIDHGSIVDLGVLRTIPAESVVEIVYFEPVSARIRFGNRYGGGVILVRTAARRPMR
jgi:hypothetical protein